MRTLQDEPIRLSDLERKVFNEFAKAAVEGHRAPTNAYLRAVTQAVPRPALNSLMRREVIEVRIYGHNWRVVRILKGEHRGKATLHAPLHWQEHTSSMERRGAL